MRGTMLIGLAVVLLIIGILAVKNMGTDKPGGVQEAQTKEYVEKAKTAAADAAKRMEDIKNQKRAVD